MPIRFSRVIRITVREARATGASKGWVDSGEASMYVILIIACVIIFILATCKPGHGGH